MVLERKIVAGLDAAVLEASQAEALQEWLKKHGYPSSAQLADWARPYIAAKWKITAFKIDAGASPRPVRMSFATDTPFFPYREPAGDAFGGKRLLRVYLLSDARVEGTIGKDKRFEGETVWSDRIPAESFADLLKLVKLPDSALKQVPLWLTEIEDRSNPRPVADDLVFQRAQAQDIVKRPPIRTAGYYTNAWWFDLVAVGVVLAFVAAVIWLVYRIFRWLHAITAR